MFFCSYVFIYIYVKDGPHPQLNEHNKQEFPPAHNSEFDTSQTKSHATMHR